MVLSLLSAHISMRTMSSLDDFKRHICNLSVSVMDTALRGQQVGAVHLPRGGHGTKFGFICRKKPCYYALEIFPDQICQNKMLSQNVFNEYRTFSTNNYHILVIQSPTYLLPLVGPVASDRAS